MNEKEIIEYIKKWFIYNENGSFDRKDRKNSNGSYDKDGYLIIKIKGKQYKAHRLVFAFFYNRFPEEEIDHINRNRKDNRIQNLKECNRKENINNSIGSGFGIYIAKTSNLKKNIVLNYRKKLIDFIL